MIEFVLGSAGTGKSREICRRVEQAAREGRQVFLFVPEQFTFETERGYYNLMGPKVFRHLTVISFTRLSHRIFKEFGGTAGDYADDSMKLLFMDFALHQVKEELGIYGKNVGNLAFSREMVELVNELKNADQTVDSFAGSVERMEQGTLRRKSRDISLIFSTYEALLSAGYKDAVDDIARACEKIRQQRYFRGAHVYIDEFKGFTARELSVIRLMMEQAQSVTISLCTDRQDLGPNSLFYSVNQTYQSLKRLAQQAGRQVKAPVVLTEQHRFQSPELAHLAEQVFRPRILPYERERTGAVHAVLAANEYDEVDYLLSTIRELVEKEGFRYRDMVVITRDLASYQSCLETAFSKYQVPYYLDSRKPIASSPLIRFVELALECVCGSFTTESVIAMLKCGVTPVTHTQLAALENYAYLWGLTRRQWEQPFTLSPSGVNPPRDEEGKTRDEETLSMLNSIREQVMEALGRLKRGLGKRHAAAAGKAVLRFLEDMQVREQVGQIIASAGELAVQDEYRRVWGMIGEILSILSRAAGDQPLDPGRYREQFSLVAENYDMGTIPQTLDSVTVGSAERIRTDCPKVVFLLGANDGVFPCLPENTGIYTDGERSRLLDMGLELSRPLKDRIREERFVAYKAVCTPSHRLYLTARKADVRGTAKAPSVIFAQFRRMFGEGSVEDTEDMDRLYFCRSLRTAFSVLAYQFRQDTPLTASLKEYFSTQPAYAQKMAAIAGGLEQGKYRLTNPSQIRRLYGERVVMSPTRVEQYHRCKFRYFCEQGMRLRPRERVQLNAVNRGTVVHGILYQVCSQITDFSRFDEERVRALIREAIDQQVDLLGGYENQTRRFAYLYRRIERSVMSLVRRLFDELAHSKFKPAEFEYVIGATGHVRPFTFTGPDGITVQIQGTIDRVDCYEAPDGQKYLRVIDYKTGTKEFRLTDLVNGVNLQLFLYLLCLEQSRSGPYGNAAAAGALYFPAGEVSGTLPREATREDALRLEQGHYQMKGAVLDDEQVLTAMEPELSGVYTPIEVKSKAYDKEHNLREDVFCDRHANQELFSSASLEFLLTGEQMHRLFRSIEDTVGKMVKELYSGNIEAKPLVGRRFNGCDYCQFGAVCGYEPGAAANEYLDLKKKELFDYLAQQEGEKPWEK